MTPAEVIRRLLPSAKWGNPEWQAVKEVLAEEGLVLVSAEDLRTYLDRGTDLKAEVDALRRLRAALPERTSS